MTERTLKPSARWVMPVIWLTLCLAGCTNVGQSPSPERPPDPALGVLTLPDGSKRYIAPADFAYTGKGSYTSPDARTLTGVFANGMLQGFGHEQMGNESYTGQWLDGNRHGRGELTRPGFRYEGDFADHLPHGQGTQSSAQGTYRGGFADGLFSGQGRWQGHTGTIYQGAWQAGKRQGFGQENRADGTSYSGDWQNDLPHGFGGCEYPDLGYYEGSWQAGKRHGYGVFTSAANVVYEGLWENNTRHGYGQQSRPDGSHFTGEWANDQQHGQGIAVQANGTRHEGTWQQGYIFGPGIRTNPTGVVFSGNWIRNNISNGLVQLPSGAEYGGELFMDKGLGISTNLIQWLYQVAKAQDPHAQYLLGTAHLDFNQPARDPTTARVWLHKAAQGGHAEAQYRLARLLEGDDINTSIHWLEQAANSGHPGAALTLGQYYHRGHHLVQDLRAAMRLYRAAFSKGSVHAANNLAWLLATTSNEELANPEQAIELIQPFVIWLGNAAHLDTLAAAHARLGNMELAVRMQRQAVNKYVNSMGPSDVDQGAEEMRARLALYEIDQPYIE